MSSPDRNRLPTSVVPSHYELELTPDLDAAAFAGTVAIDVIVQVETRELVLHALDLEVAEIWLHQGDRRIDAMPRFDEASETMALTLAEPAEPGEWVIEARFTGELNSMLVGFYRSSFTNDAGETQHLACTQFESTHARRAFPCFDEPSFKATFGVQLVVPEDLMAISNAAEIQVEPLGDGRKRVQFAPTMRMSTYLVAFVVGPLEATAPVDVDGVPLRVITPPGMTELTPFALDVGAFSLRFLAHWYGSAYPGDKLDLVAIPDFAFGAMENLGCVTFRETALLVDLDRATQAEQQRVADVIAHEIAHMWFGDLVTMSWWNGIWLNEAFATFMEMLTTDAYRPDWQRWVDFGSARSAAFDTDSLTTTRAIEYEVVTAADAEGMFDVLTYEKGASVVRMLQQYLGEDAFQAGIRQYLRTHQYANTETSDLWDALEDATGEPVREMMDTWIFTPGHPVVDITRTADGLRLRQDRFRFHADPGAGVDVPLAEQRPVPVVLRVGTADGETTQRVLLGEAHADVSLEAEPTWIVGNHQSNGFYRVALAETDLDATASAALASLSASERYGLIEDEWALLLAGRGSLPRIIAVAEALAGEQDLVVWRRLAAVFGALRRMAAPTDRPRVEAWVRSLAGPALDRLGDAPAPDEPERTGALRAVLFEAVARTGADPDRRSQADAWFEQLGSEPRAVDADLADAVVRVVAATADGSRWEELRRRAGAAHTAQDRLRHQGALADSSEVELVLRFCALTLTDEIRSQDALFLLRRALVNSHTTAEVWAFIIEHWDEITTRFPSSTVPRLVEGIRAIAEPTLAAEVARFLDERPPAQGETVVRQHRERMWVTVAATARVRGELPDAWS